MDEDERAPIIPLVPRGSIEGEPLPIVPLDRHDPIGDIAHRLGVSRRTAAGYYSRALKAVREAAETSPTEDGNGGA